MKTEPVTRETVNMIASVIGSTAAMIVRLGDVDLSKGAGIISNNEKCLWTMSGHRISVLLSSDGGVIASCGKEPDPDIPT